MSYKNFNKASLGTKLTCSHCQLTPTKGNRSYVHSKNTLSVSVASDQKCPVGERVLGFWEIFPNNTGYIKNIGPSSLHTNPNLLVVSKKQSLKH